ncbi:restriction endonuclease subunit S [Barnesiella sp. WM24]|uniref:restriction endonuclease subunit S n=1 Tax=Barnesiella sp. WM24 TaxID=2558278 RepID=UPI001071F680|nr:restriction endonuclease subunit S [Barnesiella sp. WM24]TFU94384.1 restriction endonuclease subunit S [Barnesiella sp. WM24]
MIETNFRHTDIGPIPHDWEVKRTVDLFDINAAGDLMRDNYSEVKTSCHIYPIYSNSNIDKGLYGYTSSPRYRKNSFTITGRGNLGIAEYRNTDFDAIIRLLVLSPKKGASSLFYSYYTNFAHPYEGSATSIPQLPIPNVAKGLIPVPPVGEQEAIGKALSDIDGLIDVLRKLIEKKRNIKQGAMSRLLSGSLRLPGFNKPWKTNLLSDVASYGNVPLPSDMFDAKNYVCTENMISNRGGIIPYDDYVCSYMVKSYVPYDILISNIRPYLKKIWFADCSGGVSADVLVVRSNYDIINAKFLYTILSHDKFFSYNMEGIAGTKMPRGNKRHIMNYEFIMPTDLAEQEAIAKVLTDMDSEIENLEKKLAKYEQVKQGMMKQLLTGKIRLI